MLPTSHNQAYQEFLTLLQQFQKLLSDREMSKTSEWQTEFQTLQQAFQQQIACLSSEEVSEAIAPRWQSLQTEMQREFRLLTTDILFLRSARQAATREARLKSISDRLEKIIGYCQVILESS